MPAAMSMLWAVASSRVSAVTAGRGCRPNDHQCRRIVERYEGEAARVWTSAATGDELLANLRELPGFGEQKARVFTALLAKRLGVKPHGWEQAAGAYGQPGHYSVADIDGPDGLAAVRAYKKEQKARAKAKR